MALFHVNKDFDQPKLNPFREHKAYDSDWILFKLLDSSEFEKFSGGGKDGIFQIILSKAYAGWEYGVFDCIQYETLYNRNIILAMDDSDFQHAKDMYTGHSFQDAFLRPHEKKVLVHSTTAVNYTSIMETNSLESWNRLKQRCIIGEERPIGSLLGDPEQYSDYIMFGFGGYSHEIVVASKQKGYLEMDADTPYMPGVRLYFDASLIAGDGLLIRDGLHMKVKDSLPLTPYLLCAVTPACLDVFGETTPREYALKADEYFYGQTGIRL